MRMALGKPEVGQRKASEWPEKILKKARSQKKAKGELD
jgi:hypothetical protein